MQYVLWYIVSQLFGSFLTIREEQEHDSNVKQDVPLNVKWYENEERRGRRAEKECRRRFLRRWPLSQY